jgi:hypothetical protein
LLSNPNGSKYFWLKHRINRKEKALASGAYFETSLKVARKKRGSKKASS